MASQPIDTPEIRAAAQSAATAQDHEVVAKYYDNVAPLSLFIALVPTTGCTIIEQNFPITAEPLPSFTLKPLSAQELAATPEPDVEVLSDDYVKFISESNGCWTTAGTMSFSILIRSGA